MLVAIFAISSVTISCQGSRVHFGSARPTEGDLIKQAIAIVKSNKPMSGMSVDRAMGIMAGCQNSYKIDDSWSKPYKQQLRAQFLRDNDPAEVARLNLLNPMDKQRIPLTKAQIEEKLKEFKEPWHYNLNLWKKAIHHGRFFPSSEYKKGKAEIERLLQMEN